MTQCRCCSWDNPIWALSCPVTATSTECPRRISGNTYDYLSSCVYPLGPVVPEKTEKICLFLGSAGSHTPSEAKHYLKVVLKYCQCMPMQHAKAEVRRTGTVSCPPLCPQPAQEGGWGQTEEGVSHGTTPTLRQCQEIFFLHEEKKHTEDFEWSNCKPRLSLQSTENLNPLLPYAWHTEVKWIHQTDS